MKEIMVSICCLVYNHEKYLRKCLDGFVNQKCNFKYEVLIHDDASTDSSPAIIREYEEKYPDIIKPIFQTENQYSKGVKISFIYQYPRAKGKYIALCEGDDYWTDPNKLQKQYEVMEQFSDCGICVHGVDAIYEDGRIKDRHYPDLRWIKPGVIKGDNLIKIACAGRYTFQTSSYFVRTSIILDYINPFPTFAQVAVSGDTPMLLFVGQRADCFYIEDTMSHYRHGSTTSRKASAGYRNDKEKYKAHYQHQIDMMNEYDRFTNGKYHKYCQSKIDAYRFMIAWHFNDYKQMAQAKNFKFMKLDRFGIKGIVKVYIGAYFPGLLYRIEKKGK